jgi:hypothetical protein
MNNKATSLVISLSKLTAKGDIKWKVGDAPREFTRGTDTTIPLFLEASYKDQNFALYQKRFEEFSGELERFYWTEKIVLALLNAAGNVAVWETSEPWAPLSDLFEAARRKAANIDGVIDALLGRSSEEEEEEL